jgi:hypothetical protein
MEARLQALEQALADRDGQIAEMARAAGEAAANAMNAGGGAQGARHLERRYDTACKSLQGAPKFDGKSSWRTFESQFEGWYRINNIANQDQEFQKRSLLICMRGQAVEMTRPYNEGSATWQASPNLAAYILALRTVFLPPEESELARTEFKVRKQGRKEDISSYLSAKISLWQLAYPEAGRSFQNLMDETIGGISNRIVKRRLRYAEINTVPDLRRQAVRLVAAERQCYMEGTSESTSMDGLSATSHIKNEQYGDDDMDVDDDGVRAMDRFDGTCRKCGTYGHKASTCRKGRTQGQGGDQRKCFTCDRPGHMKKDCRARTKANGEKIVRNPEKKKTFGKEKDHKKTGFKGKGSVRTQAEVTDEEDEQDEEDFLGEEGDSEKE